MTYANSLIPKSVKIMEVAPRDGLQNEQKIIDTPSKILFIKNLVESGCKRIELTAFVSPRWIPQLADSLEVSLGVNRVEGTSYAALIPNVKGYENAVKAKVDEVSFVIAASNTHNQKNLNAETSKVLERYQEVAKRAVQDNRRFRAYISCAFGCPYEGNINVKEVVKLAKELINMGAYEIAVSDTIGVASPLSTINVLQTLLKEGVDKNILALHMHDTRGGALANIYAALTLGISSFDSSAGGLGGCPYAPGAAGNVATQDLVYMLESMGISTGISLNKLCDATLAIEKVLNKKTPSKIMAIYRTKSCL